MNAVVLTDDLLHATILPKKPVRKLIDLVGRIVGTTVQCSRAERPEIPPAHAIFFKVLDRITFSYAIRPIST